MLREERAAMLIDDPASMRPGQVVPRNQDGLGACGRGGHGFNEAGAGGAPEYWLHVEKNCRNVLASMRPGQVVPRNPTMPGGGLIA